MKEQGQVPGRTASEQYVGQPQARTIADLERQLAEAQGANERLKAVLDTANRQHQWDVHGEFGREAGCLDCQRYADVL